MACPTFFPPPVETVHSCLSSHSTACLACSESNPGKNSSYLYEQMCIAAQSISQRVLPCCRICCLRAWCQGMGDGCRVALRMHLELHMGKLKLCIACWLPSCAEAPCPTSGCWQCKLSSLPVYFNLQYFT